MPRTVSFASERLQSLFPLSVRMRGEEYWLGGRVSMIVGDENRVQATVRGTRPYSVILERVGAGISMECNCEYFAGAGCCKHAWAVLLESDDAGYLMTAAGSDEPVLPQRPAATPEWERRLREVAAPNAPMPSVARVIPTSSEILYVVEAEPTMERGLLTITVGERRPKKKGGWTKLQPLPRATIESEAAVPEADRDAVAWLLSSREPNQPWQHMYLADALRFTLQAPLARHVTPRLAATLRLFLRRQPSDPDEGLVGPLAWDGGPAWQLAVRVAPLDHTYAVEGELVRGDERRPLDSAHLVAAGLAFFDKEAAYADAGQGEAWLREMREAGRIEVPRAQVGRFQELLAEAPRPPRLEVPAELQIADVVVAPRPRLNVLAPDRWRWGRAAEMHRLEVSFDYDGVIVGGHDRRRRIPDLERRRVLLRDTEAERRALARLRDLGAQADAFAPPDEPGLAIAPKHLRPALRALLLEGWPVKVEGSRYRVASGVRFGVTSGIDWFDLHGEVTFDDGSALPLDEILEALRKGQREVTLGPGETVILPEDWSRRFGLVARMGERAEGGLRFGKGQVGLLDALLAAQPEPSVDAAFARARERLKRFAAVAPASEPRGFKGELRPYQREGLGWMRFLQELGFGGCLADDMGLGKTVQVLALLLSRRSKADRPSLVVAPRSLVFNWIDEARRFTPGLRVVDQSGPDRERNPAAWKGADVVLVTYGILRRDAALFDGVRFDYAILDEAQAVKNAQSETAKAARLLKADHRLALSGTPVQNHLGELWSLFEFLNPGLLGRSGAFEATLDQDDPRHALLSALLRPFILRRTKEQVVKELPRKTEQTLYCDLEGDQLKLYRGLRDQFRASVLAAVDRQGLARSKMHVLEALLRLRQAACHPGLVAPERDRAPSAKLEALLPLLAEVIDEGHKALVFSQFTSFLKLLAPLLERRGIVFEYLDGQTRDRAARVRRFQEDPDCSAFLVSLKAGGLGLNLTAAEYVFILDPWWNPAAEAQAVDRAHRIGQKRPVFAYRIIARGTVEEKVVELQRSKKQLAEALLTEDMSLIRGLKREDLEALLS